MKKKQEKELSYHLKKVVELCNKLGISSGGETISNYFISYNVTKKVEKCKSCGQEIKN